MFGTLHMDPFFASNGIGFLPLFPLLITQTFPGKMKHMVSVILGDP